MSDNFPDQIVYQFLDGDISYDDAIGKLQKSNSMKQLYIGNQEICDMLEATDVIEGMAQDEK